jgi:hypothetical protein
LLTLDRRSLTLSVASDLNHDQRDVVALVRIFVPKILGSWYPLALHASAVAFHESAILFSGASGAGKTTTARTLAETRGDVTLLSEDLVLFASVGTENAIVLGAEAAVLPFLENAAERLAFGKDASIGVESLLRALETCTDVVPLRKIVFLDATRRQGSRWTISPITRARALRLFFVNSFLGSSTPAVLRAHLKACRAIASESLAAEATAIPAQLEDLRAQSPAQIEIIAS